MIFHLYNDYTYKTKLSQDDLQNFNPPMSFVVKYEESRKISLAALLSSIYFINSLRLLQPMRGQQFFVLQYLHRQPIGHNIAIIHHDRARK